MDPPKNKHNEIMLAYYHANKERINAKTRCELCDKELSKKSMRLHVKSNKHLKNLKVAE